MCRGLGGGAGEVSPIKNSSITRCALFARQRFLLLQSTSGPAGSRPETAGSGDAGTRVSAHGGCDPPPHALRREAGHPLSPGPHCRLPTPYGPRPSQEAGPSARPRSKSDSVSPSRSPPTSCFLPPGHTLNATLRPERDTPSLPRRNKKNSNGSEGFCRHYLRI